MKRTRSAATKALTALADPTRRRLIEELRSGPRSVGDLAKKVPVSRPAVSQHLAVLKSAGLVMDAAAGTRRVYEIDPNGLGPIRAWLDDMWMNALTRFAREAETGSELLDSPSAPEAGDEDHKR